MEQFFRTKTGRNSIPMMILMTPLWVAITILCIITLKIGERDEKN